MAATTKTPEDERTDELHNPAQNLYDREFNDIAKNYHQDADSSQEDSNIEKLRKAEESQTPRGVSRRSDSDSDRSASESPAPEGGDGRLNKAKAFVGRMRKNRKAMIGLGAGGGLVTLLVAGILALIPLKLDMLIKTATQNAAQIPEYAIQHRIEYLTRYYMIMKITGAMSDTTDIDVGKGGLASSLFNTWRAAKYENELGLEIKSDRIKPGETAFKWEIKEKGTGKSLAHGNDFNEGNIERTIVGSTEMRTFLKQEVKDKTQWHQFYKRYAMRKTLMRTKGVSRWSWLPNSTAEKMDNYAEKKRALRREFKTNMYKYTIGRVAPRTMLYIGCVTNADSCADLKNNRFGTTVEPDADCTGLTDAQCTELKNRYAEADKNLSDSADRINQDLDATIDQAVDMDASSTEVSRWFSKQLLTKLVGGVGILDVLFRIIDSIDKGGINQVVYDRNSIMTVGYASEMQTILSQRNEGKLTSAQFDVAMSQLGDFGPSPAWQQEAGILPTAGKQFERFCLTSNTERGTLILEPGETVCPERKIIQDFTSFTKTNPFWGGLAELAEWYKNSIGKIFDFFNAVVSFLQIDKVIGWILDTTGLSDLIGKVVETLFGMIFGSPVTGSDSGAEAGDNVLGGLKASYFALGEAGQDTDEAGVPNGGGLGIGGAVMTQTATKELKSKIAAEKNREFQTKSFFAKMFDTSETRSVASQLAIRTPTNVNQLSMVPGMIQNSFLSIFAPNLLAAGEEKDQFGFDFAYGYSDAELVADPAKYNDTTCVEYGKAREASYKSPADTEFPIYVYTKTDPCALEKVVVASGSAMFTNGADSNFQLGGVNNNVITPGTTPPAPTTSGGWVWPTIPKGSIKQKWGVWNFSRGGYHKGIDIAVPGGSAVVAAHAGTVVGGGMTYDNSCLGRMVTISVNGASSPQYMVYQHLSPTGPLPSGTVTAGQVIGKVASLSEVSSSCVGSYAHLHFQLQKVGTYIVSYKGNLDLTMDPAPPTGPLP